MRDLKKMQLQEKRAQEKARLQSMRGLDEEWDSEFHSTRQSRMSLGYQALPKLEYNDRVESALEKFLGKEDYGELKNSGKKPASAKEKGDVSQEGNGEENREENEEGQEEEDKVNKSDEENEGEGKEENEGKEEQEDKDKVVEDEPNGDLKNSKVSDKKEKEPLKVEEKPWSRPEAEDRTEIVLGVRYNRDFEELFDDRVSLKNKVPSHVVRIIGHFNENFVVGIQFFYMTKEGELLPGKFHGDKKVTMNRLQKVEFDLGFKERIQELTVYFSKGTRSSSRSALAAADHERGQKAADRFEEETSEGRRAGQDPQGRSAARAADLRFGRLFW
jgi:hypothetical protein